MAQATRKIHHLIEDFEDQYVVDPQHGVIKKRVSIIAPSTIHRLSYKGAEYTIGKDGAFDVPHDVAAFFLRGGGWHEGPGVALLHKPEEIEAELKTKKEIAADKKEAADDKREAAAAHDKR